jgi:4-amino-4-deoxy-L-arabinose transferase-like glycosyltransferase
VPLRRGVTRPLLLIVALGVCLRAAAFGGLVGTDDPIYADLAHRLATGQFRAAHDLDLGTFPLRVGTFAPAALAFRVLGVNEVALAAYPFLLSVLSIVLAFAAGRMFFGDRAGLIAALMQACLPIDVRYSTLLFPDLVAAFWTNVGILLLYRGSTRLPLPEKAALGLVSGLALGVSWLSKEPVMFSLPFIGAYLLWSGYLERRNTVLALAVAAGFSTVVLAESLAYYAYFSDARYHLHALERHNQLPDAMVWFWNPDRPWSGGLLARLFRDGPQVMLLNTQFGLVTAIAVLSIAYGVFRRFPGIWFVSLWFLYHAFIFNFGSHSLRAYMPLPAWERYFYPVLLPAVLLGAALLASLLKREEPGPPGDTERRFWGLAVASVLLLAFAHGIYRDLKANDISYVERSTARMIPPDTTLYTDARTAWLLRFFWSYPAQTATRDFTGVPASAIPPGAHVLLNPKRVAIMLNYGQHPPAFFETPPAAWVKRWEGASARLYQMPDAPR